MTDSRVKQIAEQIGGPEVMVVYMDEMALEVTSDYSETYRVPNVEVRVCASRDDLDLCS